MKRFMRSSTISGLLLFGLLTPSLPIMAGNESFSSRLIAKLAPIGQSAQAVSKEKLNTAHKTITGGLKAIASGVREEKDLVAAGCRAALKKLKREKLTEQESKDLKRLAKHLGVAIVVVVTIVALMDIKTTFFYLNIAD